MSRRHWRKLKTRDAEKLQHDISLQSKEAVGPCMFWAADSLYPSDVWDWTGLESVYPSESKIKCWTGLESLFDARGLKREKKRTPETCLRTAGTSEEARGLISFRKEDEGSGLPTEVGRSHSAVSTLIAAIKYSSEIA